MAETGRLQRSWRPMSLGSANSPALTRDSTLVRLRALRSDLIEPRIAIRHGRVVKRTGDGLIVEFRSVVVAVRCAIEVQDSVEHNAGPPPERRTSSASAFIPRRRRGERRRSHGRRVNIVARLDGIAARARSAHPRHASRLWCCDSPTWAPSGARAFRRRNYREPDDRSFAHSRLFVIDRDTAFTHKSSVSFVEATMARRSFCKPVRGANCAPIDV